MLLDDSAAGAVVKGSNVSPMEQKYFFVTLIEPNTLILSISCHL
jgi:hypothetical protein